MIGLSLEVFKINFKNKMILFMTIIILIILATRTFIRSFDWKDNFTLASHDIKVSREAYALEHELSNNYFAQGRYEDARLHAERSIKLFPYVFNYTDLGNADLYLGDYKGAKSAYLKAIRYGDNLATYDNLSALGTDYGNPKENIEFIKNTALKKYPLDERLWLYLAVLDYRIGNTSNAKDEISKAYTYNIDGVQEITNIYPVIMNNQPLKFHVGK